MRPVWTMRFAEEMLLLLLDEKTGYFIPVFMAVEPLSGQRTVRVIQCRTRTDWAHF